MAPDPDLELRERGRGHAGFSSFCHFFIFCPIKGGRGGGRARARRPCMTGVFMFFINFNSP